MCVGSQLGASQIVSQQMQMRHVVISNKANRGLDILLETSARVQLQTRVLGLGSNTPIGHGKGFGLKLELLKAECETCDPKQPVLFTDAWDVLFQDSVQSLLTWLDQHPGKVLFAAELAKWPDEHLPYPQPLGTPFPFLNSGCFCGRAEDILKLLQKPFDFRTNDQGFYSHQFVDPNNTIIELDHAADFFLCMYDLKENDIGFKNGHVDFRGKRPPILHLNNTLTKQKWYQKVAECVLQQCLI